MNRILAVWNVLLITALVGLAAGVTPARAEPAGPAGFTVYLPLAARPYPTAPATGLRIAYSSHWTGELMQYDLDSGAVSQLLPDHFMADGCWRFSPDQAAPRLLYLFDNPSSDDLNVNIRDLFGAQATRTLPAEYHNSCSNFWHPSGAAFAAYNAGTSGYDLLAPSGAKIAPFWGDLGWKAAFSPDGSRVVFVSPFRSNVLRFFTILKDAGGNITGLNQEASDFVVVDTGERFIEDIEWAPDGGRLAIVLKHSWDLGDADILLIRPDGGVLANLTNGFNRQDGKNQYYKDIQWSPTQAKLAFWVYNREGDSLVKPQVYVLDLYSGRITELTGGAYPVGETPSFSPDGNKIVFTASPQFGRTIVLCNPDGSDKRALPIENSAFGATFRP